MKEKRIYQKIITGPGENDWASFESDMIKKVYAHPDGYILAVGNDKAYIILGSNRPILQQLRDVTSQVLKEFQS